MDARGSALDKRSNSERTSDVPPSEDRGQERSRSGPVTQSLAPGLVGESPPIREVSRMIDRIARTDATVLITGETGTGKEVVSRAIHAASLRRQGPFVAVNLAAVPETLVEAEIFGHDVGAFTGARTSRPGKLEQADGGTLFLDELGELPLPVQVKLLRVLQEGEFERLGGTKVRKANFRLLGATHRDLEELVREGRFREDLLYRLDVLRIHLPPLRERTEDIEMLAAHFLGLYNEKHGREGLRFSAAAIETLKSHRWPGNVRELQHTIERAVVTCDDEDTIGPELIQARPHRVAFVPLAKEAIAQGRGLDEVLSDIERRILVETMTRFAGNQSAVSKHLKLNRQTLRNRLQKHGLL